MPDRQIPGRRMDEPPEIIILQRRVKFRDHGGLKLIRHGRKVVGQAFFKAIGDPLQPLQKRQIGEFADYFAEEEEGFTEKSYWYNRRGIRKIDAIHKYLEEQDQIGKVLSISSTEQVFSQIIDGDEIEDFHLCSCSLFYTYQIDRSTT